MHNARSERSYAGVDRMVALGLLMVADSTDEPKWTEGIKQTAIYRDAWNN